MYTIKYGIFSHVTNVKWSITNETVFGNVHHSFQIDQGPRMWSIILTTTISRDIRTSVFLTFYLFLTSCKRFNYCEWILIIQILTHQVKHKSLIVSIRKRFCTSEEVLLCLLHSTNIKNYFALQKLRSIFCPKLASSVIRCWRFKVIDKYIHVKVTLTHSKEQLVLNMILRLRNP